MNVQMLAIKTSCRGHFSTLCFTLSVALLQDISNISLKFEKDMIFTKNISHYVINTHAIKDKIVCTQKQIVFEHLAQSYYT